MTRAASRSGAEPSDTDAWLAELISEESASALSHGSRTAALGLGREVCFLLTQTIERKAADLVRLALFTEYKRHPLRREEDASRAFPVIFAYAQSLLRTTFAFELVELRARNQENPLLLEMAEALDERAGSKRQRTEGRPRKDTSSAATWMLRSTLPPHIVAAMNTRDGQQEPIMDWHADSQLAGMGVLFLVLSIILLCGRRVDEGRLRAYLAQLSLSVDRPLPSALQPFHASHEPEANATQARQRFSGDQKLTLESYLTQLQRHGYIEKVRAETVRAADGSTTSPPAEYRWGPRAEVEIGEHAVGAFVERMFGPVKQENREAQSNIKKRIERAAGTPLVG